MDKESSAPSPDRSGGDFFDLPEITAADDAFLKSHPSPTFEQQIAHARWLLAWRRRPGAKVVLTVTGHGLKDTETPVKFGGFTPAEADANLAAVRAVLDQS